MVFWFVMLGYSNGLEYRTIDMLCSWLVQPVGYQWISAETTSQWAGLVVNRLLKCNNIVWFLYDWTSTDSIVFTIDCTVCNLKHFLTHVEIPFCTLLMNWSGQRRIFSRYLLWWIRQAVFYDLLPNNIVMYKDGLHILPAEVGSLLSSRSPAEFLGFPAGFPWLLTYEFSKRPT